MLLPRGITGFRDRKAPALPISDRQAFRAACHAAARALNGRVESDKQINNDTISTYQTTVLTFASGQVAVLLHEHFELIGFARADLSDSEQRTFVDNVELAECFRSAGYEVLSQAQLEAPVADEDLSALAPAELKQIRYWRPKRVGDIVFNHWD